MTNWTPSKFMKWIVCSQNKDCFNPYRDKCPHYDLNEAPSYRYHMMLSMLKSASNQKVDSLWIGRDLGHRGGRRTGLALTDEYHILEHTSRFGVNVNRFTRGSIMKEQTATIIWDMVSQIKETIFFWNVFPFHPHESDDCFTNRAHTKSEREIGMYILQMLIQILSPRHIIGIGNDAKKAVDCITEIGNNDLDKVSKVRHPSYGGQSDFRKQIQTIYNLPDTPIRQSGMLV